MTNSLVNSYVAVNHPNLTPCPSLLLSEINLKLLPDVIHRLGSQDRLTDRLINLVIDRGRLTDRLVPLQGDRRITHLIDRLEGQLGGRLPSLLVALPTRQPRGLIVARLTVPRVARLLTRITDRLLTHIDTRHHP